MHRSAATVSLLLASALFAGPAHADARDDLKAAFGKAADACKACHDDFRNP